jgi:hypothetical protein
LAQSTSSPQSGTRFKKVIFGLAFFGGRWHLTADLNSPPTTSVLLGPLEAESARQWMDSFLQV